MTDTTIEYTGAALRDEAGLSFMVTTFWAEGTSLPMDFGSREQALEEYTTTIQTAVRSNTNPRITRVTYCQYSDDPAQHRHMDASFGPFSDQVPKAN
jgi:hypothetical protein